MKNKSDRLVEDMEDALDFGEFISYERSWDFVSGLEWGSSRKRPAEKCSGTKSRE